VALAMAVGVMPQETTEDIDDFINSSIAG